jgi:hypothetical protein
MFVDAARIGLLHAQGRSVREIAAELGVFAQPCPQNPCESQFPTYCKRSRLAATKIRPQNRCFMGSDKHSENQRGGGSALLIAGGIRELASATSQ